MQIVCGLFGVLKLSSKYKRLTYGGFRERFCSLSFRQTKPPPATQVRGGGILYYREKGVVSWYMGGRKKRYRPVSFPEPLFPFLAFGGDPLGGCDRLFRGLADAFGRFALAFAILVASPCRAFVEFHKCRPVETFVRHLAEIGDVRVGLGLGFQLPARR